MLKKVLIGIVSIFIYLPIIGGILAPMVVIIGIDLYISWILIGYNFTDWAYYLMIIYSDIADIKLKKKYPEEFQSYYENSGFFLPRLLPYRISYYFSAIYNKKYRYILLFSIYILCIYKLYQLFLVLPFYWIVM